MNNSYERTWQEIETMLDRAERTKNGWQVQYEYAKENENRRQMIDAARNFKALQGVEKTLRWVLGEHGIITPLE